MIVGWCSQVERNSTVEALAAGVPTVAFPQWTDQETNAKMMEDVWKTGVRVRKREGHEEIERCVEMVMGNEEMRRNVKKWKDVAREAVKSVGSSTINLQAFLDDA
ncbi:UDP-Glycosyltransferase superfamily protein [Artemisia annua]|uniref:UDP-Glycosyltransferase superfamily protein n=1 Tax=Artemisia annua TaxID=35608 RepID=A0A2U1NS21_ARTAN|nr:UDP-Glycosyltransferase superfamily protein [Artemisia annua]